MVAHGGGARSPLRELAATGLDDAGLRRVHAGLGGASASVERRLAAFVVAETGQTITETDLRQHLVEMLPLPMVPAIVRVVPEIPRTANGKVDRSRLSDEASEGQGADADEGGAGASGASAEDTLRDAVEAAWQLAIGPNAPSRAEHFFRAGGSSLAAMRAVSALSRDLEVDIPLVALFRQPSLVDFTAFLRTLIGDSPTTGHL